MYLLFLGTGAGVPSRQRNVSALAACFPGQGNETWLFDCGEGTQQQILQTPIKPTKITKIFISHLHGDHLFGLPGLLSTRSVQGAKDPLMIYGPPGIAQYIEVSLQSSQSYLRYPLHVKEISDGLKMQMEKDQLSVRQLEHGIPSYGFRIQRPDQPGNLDSARLIQLGVPPGPIFQEIKQGKLVKLPDGRILDGKEFVSEPKPGLSLVYLGDTRPTKAAVQLAQDADILVHEATFDQSLSTKAAQHFHSTTVEAAQIAQQANVERLILTHVSSRYLDSDADYLLSEAKGIFPQTYLAHDFWKFSIPE